MDVKAGVRLESFGQIFSLEGGRAGEMQISPGLLRYDLHKLGEDSVGILVPDRDNHDLQRSFVVGDARSHRLDNFRKEPLVSLPTHILENDSLFGWRYR